MSKINGKKKTERGDGIYGFWTQLIPIKNRLKLSQYHFPSMAGFMTLYLRPKKRLRT